MSVNQSKEYKDLLKAHGCAYCGDSFGDITIDHILSRANGGKDSRGNLVPACSKCNAMKGSMGVVEFYARCKRIGKIFPRLWSIVDNKAYWNIAEKVKQLAKEGQ